MCMTATSALVRVTRPIDALLGQAQAELVVRSGEALFAINEQFLAEQCERGESLDLDDQRVFRRLTSGVEPWQRCEPREGALWVLRNGALEQIDVRANSPAKRVLRAKPGEALVDALRAADTDDVLCVSRDDSERDLSTHRLRWHDGATDTPLLRTSVRPLISWSSAAACFLIFDPCSERSWRLPAGGDVPIELDLRRTAGRSIAAIDCHPTDRWITMRTIDSSDGSTSFVQGWVTPESIEWHTTTRAAGGIIAQVRWRPDGRDFAFVRYQRRHIALELMDSITGDTLSLDLPRGGLVSDLTWSRDGERMFVASGRTIGVWHLRR